jgi:hypothetical protein
MAPCTHIRLAFGAAPGGRIRFGSLEFANIDGPAPVNGLILGQALLFGDLDFVVDRLGQLRLSEENEAPPHISMLDHRPAQARGAIVDSGALACRIHTYLRATRARAEPTHVLCVGKCFRPTL